MPDRFRPLFVLAFALSLVACAEPAAPPAAERPAGTEAVRPAEAPARGEAPDFSLQTPGREAVTLSDYRGEVVVVNFWATWCVPCVAEVPDLNDLYTEFRDQGLRVVGVSQDAGPSASTDVTDFAEMFDVQYPMVLDPGLRTGRAFGVTALPRTFIVDRDGSIYADRVGLLSHHDLLHLLEDLIDVGDFHDHDHHSANHEASAPPRPPRPSVTHPDEPAIEPLALDEAADWIASGAMVIDLRPEALRLATGTLPYAFPLDAETFVPETFPANFGTPIVVLDVDDEAAEAAALTIAGWGYAHARPLAGGLDAWTEAGYPLDEEEEQPEGKSKEAPPALPKPLADLTGSVRS